MNKQLDDIRETAHTKQEAPTPSSEQSTVKSLFRSQAVKHALTHQYGTVILAPTMSHQVLTTLFVTLAACVIAFFVFFSTTRKVQSPQGVTLPSAGVIRVLPGQADVVQERRVNDGQEVKKGQMLLVLSSERGSGDDTTPEKIISALSRAPFCAAPSNARFCTIAHYSTR